MPGNEIKIALLGHTGSGKSSAGNTIIGNNFFDSDAAATSQTRHPSTSRTIHIDGYNVKVADTPGFCDTRNIDVESKIHDFIVYEFKPHVILFVITLGNRFPKEAEVTLKRIEALFGSSVYSRHGIVLFTSEDYLKGESLRAFVQNQAHQKVKDLVKNCDGRYVGFDNTANEDSRRLQVLALMRQISIFKELTPYSLPSANGSSWFKGLFNRSPQSRAANDAVFDDVTLEIGDKYKEEFKKIITDETHRINKKLQIIAFCLLLMFIFHLVTYYSISHCNLYYVAVTDKPLPAMPYRNKDFLSKMYDTSNNTIN